ncbi:unnamed protein product [Paramecium pentaurelia]|uniref:Phosphatidylserine synthase n=1 Tax=Paramecium pentaurelia TaxID=43138 RepID=A0A8S1UXA4_9CILI|nr:unnamed protein product [Paramecium pentaurelia]
MEIQPKKIDIGIQCEVLQREYIPPNIQSTFFHESEGWSIFYRSRTISLLIFMLTTLYITSYWFQRETLQDSAYIGYIFSFLAFCAYGGSYFPNTLIQRPHPLFWRLLQSWACVYMMSIVFLIYFTPEQLQQFLQQFVDPKLGKPLPQKSYAEDCRFYTPENEHSKFYNLTSSFDVFVPAHIFGWTVKMWILRDFKLAMFQQIAFEFMEITFRHWLPNFWECWWDHVILDIIVCNTGGIVIGWYTMKLFGMKEYKWSLRKENRKDSWFKNFKRLCISPQLDKIEWKVFSSVKRFLLVIWFLVFMNLCDLSFFFNKFVLQINTAHNVMKFRVFPLGFFSIVAARDYYVYISDENVTRLGPNAWLMHAIVLGEWVLFFRNYQGIFVEKFPTYIIMIWIGIFTLFFITVFSIWRRERRLNKLKQS